MNTFLLPDLGEGLTEAEIVRWLVAEGDVVAVDQAVVEVETAKSVIELPSPYAGKVCALHGTEGQTLDVGKPLFSVEAVTSAEVYRAEEKAGSGNVLVGYGTTSTSSGGRRRKPRTAPAPAAPAPAAPARSTRVISPLVRKLAREGGVDVATLDPTGPDGLVVRADVMRALAKPPSAETRIPLTGFRKAVSAALTRSRSEIPEATVWVDVDATELWNIRESVRPGPGILAYLARFTVEALKRYPVLNSSLDTDRQEIVQHEQINLGLAAQTPRGLLVPTVAGAGSMSVATLDERIRQVTVDAREGRPIDQSGTFTLNNYGSFNVDGSAAIINHPQVAILGFGRIIDRPWVVDGQIVPRKITQMSFVFDHRVCDGGTAAGFMRAVADAVENPLAAMVKW
ncbi:dihydrolipoamide acetyltransferase family protein [Actinoplanes sp. NBRC 103695]|uniref:dihydrolipoamide acetyltransferase family protein n=1 Tax=Actinoplanes sp. NBRC 103695 TaxID=3032202 RepID=UPI0024A3F274|nr:dihydrolipoamide acetyltransferase family protein [Actinoplanes sp. NBRC 103695]GLY95348.1 dihydrolipoamide acetyltransferase component of pyruvate dehydrogenase complex [Actinoplanes sp. NBRC 103695]